MAVFPDYFVGMEGKTALEKRPFPAPFNSKIKNTVPYLPRQARDKYRKSLTKQGRVLQRAPCYSSARGGTT